ncbi:DUF1961 family protein [Asticcacaulis sp. ZE23SCel15]|uniref:DUF1961 family protein n=1 Tax=Asticcacaulis sp. ZE23SCel15 TaxID=3059027 RepID=UPI00265F062E|nr:DUF1961 family protein [Asticcacaulis sp. ZE23SCel15]WKL57950.1 DUF1961 family protein [Asticcacaulis sp. ZE23SCel15]
MISRRQLAGGLSALGLVGTGTTVAAQAAKVGDIIYHNPLSKPEDIAAFKLEGEAKISFERGRMTLQNARDPSEGQASNFVFWCPETFPDNVEISWKFWPVAEPGLCILFFAAGGILNGKRVHVLDKGLKPRAGIYDQYTQSDVDALQIAYFRRRWAEERAFHLANLRRAPGFQLLAQGADPLPDVEDATPPYDIKIRKTHKAVDFLINDLPVVHWDVTPGSPTSGSIGFRQMAPLIADYADLTVRKIA